MVNGIELTTDQIAACITRMQQSPFSIATIAATAIRAGVPREAAEQAAQRLFAHERDIENIFERSDAMWEWRWGNRQPCPLTPIRLEWLLTLAQHSPQPWIAMPRKRGSGKHVLTTNRTWDPMVAAGWLTAEYGTRENAAATWWFSITDNGRRQIPEAE